jgi:hypothetical protein
LSPMISSPLSMGAFYFSFQLSAISRQLFGGYRRSYR